MVVPESRCDQRNDGDREKQTRKGNTPVQRQYGAVERRQRAINVSSHVAINSGNRGCYDSASVAELVKDRLDPRAVREKCVYTTRIEMATALRFQKFDAF